MNQNAKKPKEYSYDRFKSSLRSPIISELKPTHMASFISNIRKKEDNDRKNKIKQNFALALEMIEQFGLEEFKINRNTN